MTRDRKVEVSQHRLDSPVPFVAIERHDGFHVVRHTWRRRQLSAIVAGNTAALVVTVMGGGYLIASHPSTKLVAITAIGTVLGFGLLALLTRLRHRVTTRCFLHFDDASSTLHCEGINRGSPVAVSLHYTSHSIVLRPISVVSPHGVPVSWSGWLAQLQLGTGPCLDLVAHPDADKCLDSVERVFHARFRLKTLSNSLECVGSKRLLPAFNS